MLDTMYKWLCNYQLSFNKKAYVTFINHTDELPSSLKIKINETEILNLEYAKYLNIFMD